MLRLREWLQGVASAGAGAGAAAANPKEVGKCAAEEDEDSPKSVVARSGVEEPVTEDGGEPVCGARDDFVVTAQDARDVLSQTPGRGTEGSVDVDWNGRAQVMEGVGGSVTWYANHAFAHPAREKIMDAVFSELRPSVLRLRNAWRQGSDDGGEPGQTTKQMVDEAKEIVEAARKRLGAEAAPRVLLSSWSPPTALKASGRLHGADVEKGEEPQDDVLRKDEFGVFVYREFAQYWLDSLEEYAKRGVVPTWIRCVAILGWLWLCSASRGTVLTLPFFCFLRFPSMPPIRPRRASLVHWRAR